MSDEKIQYLLDRLDIQDTLTRYANALDTGRLDLFDDVFTDDAVLHYTGTGLPPTSYAAFRESARKILKTFTAWQHLLGNFVIEIDGDTATAMTDVYNPLILAGPGDGDGERLSQGYARYHDKLIRTPEGWRIKERHVEGVWRDDPAVTQMEE